MKERQLSKEERRHIYNDLTGCSGHRKMKRKAIAKKHNVSVEKIDAIWFEEKMFLAEQVYNSSIKNIDASITMKRLKISHITYYQLLSFYKDVFVKLDITTVKMHGAFPSFDNLILSDDQRRRLNEIRDIKISKYKKFQAVVEDLEMNNTKAYSMKRHRITSDEYDNIIKLIDLERH